MKTGFGSAPEDNHAPQPAGTTAPATPTGGNVGVPTPRGPNSAGTGCDAQYLFAEDILGANRGHMPRHSKAYRNFAAEYDRLQQERIAAFREYVADVESRAYPEEKHIVRMPPDELKAFLDRLGS